MSQYGPLIAALIAALIALFGVSLTLIVNGNRDRARYRNQREDDYRHDQRTAVAAIAVAAHNFYREYEALAHPYPGHEHHASANAASTALLSELTVARLLIYDSTLQGALDNLYDAWYAVVEAAYKVGTESKQGQAGHSVAESLKEELRKFEAVADLLYTAVQEKLKPTVVEAE